MACGIYWLAEKNGYKIIAVADCTGHGVPGALMSMLGITLLNEIVLNKEITNPGEILNELRRQVIQSLHQTSSEESNLEGMDIAICAFEEKTKKLHCAGANNSVIIANRENIKELTADKMPVRLHHTSDIPYNVRTEVITENDTVFLFSDGFANQFGGEDNRKFRSLQLKNLFKEVAPLTPKEQRTKMLNKFMLWKGDEEQIDDIMILGFSIK